MAILVLPIYPLIEKKPTRDYYSNQQLYKRYDGENTYDLLFVSNNNNSSTTFTLTLSPKENGYAISSTTNTNTFTTPIVDNTLFTEIVVFENKLYACDNENGLIFEVFNSLHNESNPSLFNYSNLIPRYILPANETGEFNSMKIGLCFAKDSIFHVISNNYVVAALDTEFRIRWGMWENVFTQAGSSLDCDSIEYGKVAYSHMNHTFVFIPFSCCRSGASQSYGCNKIIVTDVEYNIKTTLEFSLPQNKRVEAFKLVPYHEDQLVLLVTEYGNDQTSELMVISLSGIVLLPLTTIDFTKAVSVFEFI